MKNITDIETISNREMDDRREFTNSGRSESSPTINHASVTADYCDIISFAKKNNVGFVSRDLYIFFVQTLFNVNDDTIKTVVTL